MERRENTLTLNFWLGVPRQLEVARILQEELGLLLIEVLCVQFEKKRVHVKLVNNRKIEELLAEPVRYVNSEPMIITLNGERTAEAKIHHLPVEIEEDEVVEALSEYGCVMGLDWDEYEDGPFIGLKNGLRSLLVALKKPIPNFVQICGYEVFVKYKGQPRTCQICGGTTHLRATCPTRRPATTPAAVDSDAAPDAEQRRAWSDPPPRLPPLDDVSAAGSPPEADDATQASSPPPADVTRPAADATPHRRSQQQQPVSVQEKEEEENAEKWGKERIENGWKRVKEDARKRRESQKRQASGSPEEQKERPRTRSKKQREKKEEMKLT